METFQVNFFLKADLQTKEFRLKLSQKSEILGYHRAGLFLFESDSGGKNPVMDMDILHNSKTTLIIKHDNSIGCYLFLMMDMKV